MKGGWTPTFGLWGNPRKPDVVPSIIWKRPGECYRIIGSDGGLAADTKAYQDIPRGVVLPWLRCSVFGPTWLRGAIANERLTHVPIAKHGLHLSSCLDLFPSSVLWQLLEVVVLRLVGITRI